MGSSYCIYMDAPVPSSGNAHLTRSCMGCTGGSLDVRRHFHGKHPPQFDVKHIADVVIFDAEQPRDDSRRLVEVVHVLVLPIVHREQVLDRTRELQRHVVPVVLQVSVTLALERVVHDDGHANELPEPDVAPDHDPARVAPKQKVHDVNGTQRSTITECATGLNTLRAMATTQTIMPRVLLGHDDHHVTQNVHKPRRFPAYQRALRRPARPMARPMEALRCSGLTPSTQPRCPHTRAHTSLAVARCAPWETAA
ncbi:hypothetical protein H257_03421 [Aphanomyces astaci]|uniref:Uncharacterized protein n=1 Tax=Aphanomyces astaci TaxID=112090 RepID=W4GXR4_APHAT|nr:hypothetical protein H257_03421 [Aphanomyces astaci]ETV84111.1 hypothetical protein H257_03421 [Aphanomyces astaci]|eukprot:XP_009825803.1 hypothetical protein H257_03421 [Aphanomyces astaci]